MEIKSDNMFPIFSDDYEPDCGFADTVLTRQGALADVAKCVEIAKIPNLIRSQFGLRKLFTTKYCLWVDARSVPVSAAHSSFVGGIKHVVPLGAEKQMLRAHTGRVIAVVADKQTWLDRSYAEFIDNAMSTNGAPTQPKHAIALSVFSPRPEPASARCGLVNFGPEMGFILRCELRNGTTLNSHDVLRCRTFWSERLAA